MSNLSNRQKIESGRAEAAYKFVVEVKGKSYAKDYKSYVKKLAPLIQTNGFGNTIAFVYSKSKLDSNNNNDSDNAYAKIYKQLEKYLTEKKLIEKDLMKSIVSVDSRKYRQLTTESLALINWWRRFVDGLIDDDDNK
jgi:CRISPR-associated protein Cmr5